MEKINNADIRKYTTYKLEGKVKAIYFPSNVLELKELISDFKDKKIRYKVIGNTAVLNGVKFRIREGTINIAMGEQKSHWVTLHWA